ncbi:MAG: hypothetical protein KJ011_15360 [Burkholderiaceae bacterium]|nr:hypothetical protein [Burkholderiaceae bacterium]
MTRPSTDRWPRIAATERPAAWARRLAAPCLASSLAACSVSVGIGTGVGAEALIDAGTAPDAVAASFDALVALAGPGIGITDEPSRMPAGERPRRALAPGTFDWIELAAPLRAGASPATGGRFSSRQTLACDSGSVQVRALFVNGVVFAGGDTIELETAGCRFGAVRYTGAMAMSVVSAAGYPGSSAAWSARIAVDYAGWRVETTTLPAQARTLTGPAVIDAQRLDALSATIVFDSPALSIDPLTSGAPRARQALELLSLRLDDGPEVDTASVSFELADGRFAGTDLARLGVRSHGTIGLPGPAPAYPLGTLLVSAPDDSAVYAEAVDAAQIRLELDRFLDGAIDATLATTWSGLRARL